MAHRLSGGRWTPARHHRLISDVIERAVHEGGVRAMIFAPPRHGKSQATARWGSTYALDVDPTTEIMVCSYAGELAEGWSRQVREDLAHPEHNAEVHPRSSSVSLWHTTEGGQFLAAGVGGGITGRGAQIAFIDDPIRNRADAESPTYRQRVWDWYTSTLYTRLSPDASVIVTLTRWHHDDLAGRLLERDQQGTGDSWEVISLPALAEEDDLLGRAPGEALWPERYPAETLEAIRRTIGERDWASLYQQRPNPEGSGFFPADLPTYRQRPPLTSFTGFLLSIDTNLTGGPGSDPLSALVFGLQRGGERLWLLDELHTRAGWHQALPQIKALCAQYPRFGTAVVERKALGAALAEELRQWGVAERVYEFQPGPHGSKEARATAAGSLAETGHLLVPDPSIAPWVTDYLLELRRFPAAAHDDRVDATSQALIAAFVERSLRLDAPRIGASAERLAGRSRVRG